MSKDKDFEELDFDISAAIRMINRIYPKLPSVPMAVTNDKKKLIVFVGDGYHVIDEKTVSRFYENLDDAKRD